MIRVYKAANAQQRKLIRIGIVVTTIMLFAFMSIQFVIGLRKSQGWVQHTYVVRENLQRLFRILIDMETGQRGYLITHDSSYLQPYNEGIAIYDKALDDLKLLILDDPVQLQSLQELDTLARNKMAELAATIDLKRENRPTALQQVIKTNVGFEYMNAIRDKVVRMQTRERDQLNQRLFTLKRYYTYLTIILAGFLVIGLTLLSQFFRLLDSLESKEIELKKMNDQLELRVQRRTEQLTRSNEELERFAYVSSHDLQEPLRKIATFAQLLQLKHSETLNPEASKYLAVITEGVTRMRSLIRDLLDYSRLNVTAVSFEDVDLKNVIKDVLNDLEVAVKEKNATVIYDDLPIIRGNRTHLHQLFQNLIGNALKFHVKDARPIVQIAAKREKNYWTISVQDNGIGIEPQYADKIFKAFLRLHQKDKYPGTGIGLAICKKIVEEHGGTIWVVPAPKGGSIFKFTFYSSIPIEELITTGGH